MVEQETIKKPSWSFDVGIISSVYDDLKEAKQFAKELERGDGNALFPLKSSLQEAYLEMGGNIEGDGNLLSKEARDDLGKYFDQLTVWETENLHESMEKGTIEPASFSQLREVLKHIRSILYFEFNRNFMKLVIIYSESEKTERYAMGRTKVVS